MVGNSRPEGPAELSKREEGLDREELESAYAELYEEIAATNLDRRTLLGAFGGLAVLAALAAQKRFFGDDFEAGLAEIATKSDAPIEFDDVDAPIIGDDRTVIPESMNRAVVGLVEMPFLGTRATPTPTSAAAGALGYSRNATGVTTVATWIRRWGTTRFPH